MASNVEVPMLIVLFFVMMSWIGMGIRIISIAVLEDEKLTRIGKIAQGIFFMIFAPIVYWCVLKLEN